MAKVDETPVPPAADAAPSAADASHPAGRPVPAAVIDPSTPLPPIQNHAVGEWRTQDTEDFAANVYPSYPSALIATAGQLKTTLVRQELLTPNDTETPKFILVKTSGENVSSLLPFLNERLRKEFPSSTLVASDHEIDETTEDLVVIQLSIEAAIKRQSEWDRSQQAENGFLRLTVTADGRQSSVDGFVNEKPWVESFDRFVSANPLRDFVVGYSRDFHSSESEARRDALDDARRKAALSMNGFSYAIVDERHVIDRFAQKLPRSYGDVWREAVLLEIPSPQQVGMARTTVGRYFEQDMSTRVWSNIGIVVLMVITGLICLGLNWVTKGFYRTQLLLGLTGIIFACGFLMLLFLA